MAESLASQSIFRDPPRPTVPLSGPHDERLIAIVLAPLAAGETTQAGFARKERELGAAIAALPLADARALHARLANPRPGDAVVACLGRLAVERRHRLIAFLADARRRDALARR